ncbi:MAG: ABC-type transporter, integral membrane subunit [Candidatus Magasanikbacteria bacterium GW2011_GWA2_56_11]|uniref:ABC-type transporter, integral membrane subunit n=1 Tax=Candidatus Magasanikbacteria bacterium GW2011_GWA2_56_11 TaxID=1619044 RepID=A0A0G1YFN5_9BACT|nr:MAG: ABC-type transporter, integral membrane subunit [Candidatus Magasanikbacteria bacterium GW2011_GWA2_56_11]
MLSIFEYSFIVRGLEAGLLIGAIAPLIGIFLVLRRYSLIADTLAHVSLAGVAIGLLLKVNPLFTAILASAASSVAIERLRASKKIYGESALSIFLSGSLALAIVLIGLAHGFNVDLFSYLFGSIVTVRPADIYIILGLGAVIGITILAFYKELVYISFDEDAAKVSGIPVKLFNTVFILLAASAIAISIPIIGILLISALLVLPVVAALQLKKSFKATLLWAEVISLSSVLAGVVASFYLDVSSGGAIVLIMLAVFGAILLAKSRAKK